jgi:hypothetical protein
MQAEEDSWIRAEWAMDFPPAAIAGNKYIPSPPKPGMALHYEGPSPFPMNSRLSSLKKGDFGGSDYTKLTFDLFYKERKN